MIAVAFRDGSTTAPTLPSGWTQIHARGGNANSILVAWREWQSGDAGPQFVNATMVAMSSYSGCDNTDPIGADVGANSGGVSGTTVTIPALTLQNTSGSSWVYACYGHRTTTSFTTPSGMTERADFTDGLPGLGVSDTNAGVASFAGGTVTATASHNWRSVSVELLAAAGGAAPAQGSATGTWTTTGTATGRTERRGTAIGTWTAAGTGTGATARRGTAIAAHAWTGTATGTAPAIGASEGAATGSHTWTGSAQGMAPAAGESAGTATGTHAWTGTATGRRTSTGTASTGWTATGSATGRTTAGGTAAAAHTWAGTATGISAGVRDITATATLRRGWDADLADRSHTATLTGRAWTARLLPLNEHAGSTP